MSTGIRIRHVVSIAGVVQDRATQARMAGALVEITDGPPAFHAILAAHAADPAWRQRAERIDRTVSKPDGIFTLVDLPAGPYRLRVSAPEQGSRYGVVEAGPFKVRTAPPDGPFVATQAPIDLPPTRIRGVVSDASTGQPVALARVRLRGDAAVVKTGDDGAYDLNRQIAGKPTLEVTAARFQSITRHVELAAGQERVEDVALQPE
jgi:nucleoid-associated protein YgaU